MSIETAARFNSGNGGVSVIIKRDLLELGELLSPCKAIDLALELIHKASNGTVPPELDAAVKSLKLHRGMW